MADSEKLDKEEKIRTIAHGFAISTYLDIMMSARGEDNIDNSKNITEDNMSPRGYWIGEICSVK